MKLSIENMISTERYHRMLSILNQRTAYVQVILENLYDPHNISAIIRTSEAYGLQHIHIVEDLNPFKVSKGITMGSDQWLSIHQSKSVVDTIKGLKSRGYRVYYADPKESNPSLSELSLDKPFAILMGQEKLGISKDAIKHADSGFKIPLYGFVESFNVSVAYAIIVSTLIERLRKENNLLYFLEEKEKQQILEKWIFQNNFDKSVSSFLRMNHSITTKIDSIND